MSKYLIELSNFCRHYLKQKKQYAVYQSIKEGITHSPQTYHQRSKKDKKNNVKH